MTIDPLFYDLAAHLWRDAKFCYYWTPNDGDGNKLSWWFDLSNGVPQVPAFFSDKDTYFGVHGTAIRRSEHERANAKLGDITVISAFYFEIDCDTEQERLTALARIDALPWQPGAVVFSGGGYHVYILLRQPWLLDTPEAQARARDLQFAMSEFGGGDTDVKDLARVLRVPGSTNWKDKYAPDYPTVEFVRCDLAAQYDLADIEPHLAPLVAAKAARQAHTPHAAQPVGLDDQELLEVLFSSKNGYMYERLWSGDLSPANGDHSRADQMLCNGLAWATGRDIARMDALFRQSGLMRDKWTDRDDYRGRTLQNAADSAQTIYDPHYVDPSVTMVQDMATQQAAAGSGSGGNGSGSGNNGTGPTGRNSNAKGPQPQQPKRSKPQRQQANYPAIGREYMQRNPHTIYARSRWLRYGDGVWATFHDLALESEVWDLLEKHDPFPTDNGVKNVTKFVRSKRVRQDDELDHDDTLINLQNGTYDLELQALLSHSPDRLLTTQLPFEYDPLALCPNWRRYLETTFIDRAGRTDSDLIAFMQEAMGYSLTTDIKYHVTFWCYGEGANGKGVWFHLLEHLGGNAAIPFNVDLLKKEQYQLADLAGKRIALCPEADSGGVVEDALIKALVAGDALQVRQIRKEPFTLHPTVKLWWSMNKLPTVTDTSVGMWRRILLIPFNADFENRDRSKRIDSLRDLLLDELPGIFNWAMEGLARLTANNAFTVVKQVEDLTNSYRRESNTIQTFVEETCDTDHSYNVGSQTIYSRYKDWCNDNGYKPYNVRNFKTEMERLKFYHRRTNVTKVFDGLRLKGQRNTVP